MLDQEQTRRVAGTAIQAMALFDALLVELQGELPPADFSVLRLAVGKAMGEISVEVLSPCFEAYPQLAPSSAEEWRLLGGLPPATP